MQLFFYVPLNTFAIKERGGIIERRKNSTIKFSLLDSIMLLTFFQQNSEVPEANNNRPPFWRMVFVLRVSLPLIVAITSNELILP